MRETERLHFFKNKKERSERVRRLCEECVSGLIYIYISLRRKEEEEEEEEKKERVQQCTHSIDVGVVSLSRPTRERNEGAPRTTIYY